MAWKALTSFTRGLGIRSRYRTWKAQSASCCLLTLLGQKNQIRQTWRGPKQAPIGPLGCAKSGESTTCCAVCYTWKAGGRDPVLAKLPAPTPSRVAQVPGGKDTRTRGRSDHRSYCQGGNATERNRSGGILPQKGMAASQLFRAPERCVPLSCFPWIIMHEDVVLAGGGAAGVGILQVI